jgi:hypothetical protein
MPNGGTTGFDKSADETSTPPPSRSVGVVLAILVMIAAAVMALVTWAA